MMYAKSINDKKLTPSGSDTSNATEYIRIKYKNVRNNFDIIYETNRSKNVTHFSYTKVK